jgi:prevent-host-death family protein
MKTAGVRELKAHLSGFLRDVARGEVVLVTDRGRVVAQLRPAGPSEETLSPADLRHRGLVADGRLRPAPAPGPIRWSRKRPLPKGDAQALLDAERGE